MSADISHLVTQSFTKRPLSKVVLFREIQVEVLENSLVIVNKHVKLFIQELILSEIHISQHKTIDKAHQTSVSAYSIQSVLAHNILIRVNPPMTRNQLSDHDIMFPMPIQVIKTQALMNAPMPVPITSP